MKLTLDLHDIYNHGGEIDNALQQKFDEAAAKKAPLLEIIPGKGSGQLKKHVLRFLEQKASAAKHMPDGEGLQELRHYLGPLPLERGRQALALTPRPRRRSRRARSRGRTRTAHRCVSGASGSKFASEHRQVGVAPGLRTRRRTRRAAPLTSSSVIVAVASSTRGASAAPESRGARRPSRRCRASIRIHIVVLTSRPRPSAPRSAARRCARRSGRTAGRC